MEPLALATLVAIVALPAAVLLIARIGGNYRRSWGTPAGDTHQTLIGSGSNTYVIDTTAMARRTAR